GDGVKRGNVAAVKKFLLLPPAPFTSSPLQLLNSACPMDRSECIWQSTGAACGSMNFSGDSRGVSCRQLCQTFEPHTTWIARSHCHAGEHEQVPCA
ncbi:MAG TPA: hypothetical protein VIM34_01400, partial [Burkholderiaceae bacterium]